MAYTVAQNTSFLTFASVLQKIISFGYFVLVARFIGVEGTGQYFFAISFTTIFTVVADLGFAPVLTREVSKYPEQTQKYFSSVLTAKLFFGLVAYGMVALFGTLLGYSSSLMLLVYISAVTMFFDNLQTCFLSIFRAHKNLKYESLVVVLSQFTTMLVGTVALYLKAPLIWLIIAYAIPSALFVFVSMFAVGKVYGVRMRLALDSTVLKPFMAFAWPFALAGILGRLYSYSDSVLMSKILTPQEMGFWSVPYKITFAFQFIPVALSASVYPAMSSLAVTDPNKIGDLFVKAWRYLFVIIFPLSFGLFVVARPVIVLLYGVQYAPAVPVLQILLISLIGSFLSLINGALLNATGNQAKQTISVALALALNILLNVLLMPSLGIIGAAIAALVSNILLTVTGFTFCLAAVGIDRTQLVHSFVRVFFSAMVMAVIVYVLLKYVSMFVAAPVGALVYGILLWYTKIIGTPTIVAVYAKLLRKSSV